jgi:transcriptional regulator with XRE-family HTH domain
MPKKSKLKLTPVSFGNETLGQRLARIRKERGFTQNDIATCTGLTQVLVSDYERDRIRLSAEMAVRLSEAMGISTDELLRPRKKGTPARPQQPSLKQPSLKLMRRMERIESLSLYRQRALLTTIDQFLAAAPDR